MKHSLLTLLSFFLFLTGANAQNGFIRGKILDLTTGEALIGASVVIQGTGTGSSTDLDGQYSIRVAPGTYNLVISYIGYRNETVNGVQVEPGKTRVINKNLSPDQEILDQIVIEGDVLPTKGEVQVLQIKKKNSSFIDGVSGEFLRKTGDIDAAAAVSRVVGVSVEGGRYASVRGLGDRYVQTMINGLQLPSLDPDRNAVQLDLIPARLLDNIIIYKTFRPDLPGDFTGGLIDINTSTYPEVLTISASAAVGINTRATFNDQYVDQVSSSSDWTGRDNGTRELPSIIDREDRDQVPDWRRFFTTFGDEPRQRLATTLLDQTQSFNTDYDPLLDAPPPDYRFGFSVGNQLPIGSGGTQIGYQASFSYNREFRFIDDGISRVLENEDPSTGLQDIRVDQGQDAVLWGALASVGAKLGRFNKLTFNFMYNQSGTQISSRAGGTQFDNQGEDFYRRNLIIYEQRALESYQLFGEHKLGANQQFSIDWSGAFSRSYFDQPDIRLSEYFLLGALIQDGDTVPSREVTARFFETGDFPPVFGTITAESSFLVHFYRDLDQDSYTGKANFTYEFKLWPNSQEKSFLKAGARYLQQDRVFREFTYNYDVFSNQVEGSFKQLLETVPQVLTDPLAGNVFDEGVIIQDGYTARNNYKADQKIYAAYVMGDLRLTDRFRAVLGLRVERTQLHFTSFQAPFEQEGSLISQLDDTLLLDIDSDFLPSVNLTYNLNSKMNLRLAYNRTLARPTFRELAPYESFDFVNGFFIVGNPNLKRTLIDNFDLRFEVFPEANALYSISLFYKDFTDNIVPVFVGGAGGNTIRKSWENVEEGQAYGLELEVRKNLGFISPAMKNLNVYLNGSILRSISSIPDAILESRRRNISMLTGTPEDEIELDDTWRTFAQPDFIVNATVNYNDPKIDANLTFNILGNAATIFPNTRNAFLPIVLQRSAPQLNFNISYKILKSLTARFSANNLLNPYISQNYDFAEIDDLDQTAYERYKQGRLFRISLTYTFSKEL